MGILLQNIINLASDVIRSAISVLPRRRAVDRSVTLEISNDPIHFLPRFEQGARIILQDAHGHRFAVRPRNRRRVLSQK